MLYDNSAYAITRHFHYMDLTLIAAVMLVIGGRLYTAFTFTLIASVIHDAFLMPFIGFSFTANTIALTAGWLLCLSLYRENYPTKIIILAAVAAIKSVIYALLVFFFYTSATVFVFPFSIILWKIVITVVSGALIIKAAELDYKRIGSWLKTMLPTR